MAKRKPVRKRQEAGMDLPSPPPSPVPSTRNHESEWWPEVSCDKRRSPVNQSQSEFKPARPTEYRGIVYRSKSEAMFARWLELSGYQWVYEPKGFEVDGWNPDFLSWIVPPASFYEVDGVFLRPEIPTLSYRLIEFKPSRPTQTYVRAFSAKCDVIWSRYEKGWEWDFLQRCSFEIFWGSVFTNDRGVYEADFGSTPGFTEHDWIGEHENAIKQTRFDLDFRR